MIKQTVILHTIKNIDFDYLQELYFKFVELNFNEKLRYGFVNIELNNYVLSGILIKQIPTSISHFNAKTNSIEDEVIFIISTIEFRIDIQNNILEIFGSSKDASRLRSILRKHFKKSVSIKTIDLSPYKILTKLLSSNFNHSIKQLTINNFRYKDGAIGKYTANVTKNKLAYELINNYKLDVLKGIIEFNFNHQKIQIVLSNNGQLQIECTEALIDDINLYLKRTLIF